ncbi:MAG: hypothetical protein Greene071421_255 [Parcubacteria group bacterium Greene0714_21]|nr:MAG: hypothetical protein Greene041639_280 [Parcubacteria group bacterium Greene0416_39]TSC97543.1 MAG: hypothetical protein Greene101447_468 [Parcubacteria group bacterium Greene1014_47]TSD04419.1 MAG: hypothetical protein Greene071421_255 [Parcubacteria group bacterium Greene0714_21]
MDREGVTIEDLARMVAKGFEETAKAQVVEAEFRVVNERLDRIEKFLLEEHRRRIERLEDQVKEIRETLAMK